MRKSAPFAGHLRLQHLFLSTAVAQTGTVREAAGHLGRTQPALTKMLQELEASLGVTLFERGRLGARPTACGQAFVARAQVILNEWAILQDELQAIANGDAEVLRVGVTPQTALGFLPQALQRFRRERPGVLVRVREASIHDLILALAGGELDCVIGRFSGELHDVEGFAGLAHERLYDEVLSIIAGPRHPLLARRRVTWKDLSLADWVLPPAELTTRQIINSAFIRAGLNPPRPLYESSSFATSISFANQLGVLAVVPLDAATVAQQHGLVQVLRTNLAAISAPISIVQRDTALQRKAWSAFLDSVRSAARSRGA